jgi:hypothetical protein
MARTPLANHSYGLSRCIETLHARMRSLNRLGFTHDEFLALFAPKEHWEILKTASDVADVKATGGDHLGNFRHHALTAEDADMYFDVNGDGAPLMPRNHTILKKAPKELLDRLATWVNREIEVAYGFSRTAALIQWLDANCATRQQIRFIWPSIVTLCSLMIDTAELGDRLREFKPCKALPHMPPEVRAACKSTAGVIATAMLLPVEKDLFMAPVIVRMVTAAAHVNEGALGIIKPL